MESCSLPTHIHASVKPVPVWNAAEIALVARNHHADPFHAVSVDAVFRGPGGVVLHRPAFWDGGGIWKIRFAPTLPGRWTWTTTCSVADPGLDRQHGTLDAVPYRGANPFFRHGFLRVATDRRHLCHADGTP
ncbi:MAG: DUF5060 domain-containing protein, partial [Armatimonadota bacterium]